jgi:hypothetical protein
MTDDLKGFTFLVSQYGKWMFDWKVNDKGHHPNEWCLYLCRYQFDHRRSEWYKNQSTRDESTWRYRGWLIDSSSDTSRCTNTIKMHLLIDRKTTVDIRTPLHSKNKRFLIIIFVPIRERKRGLSIRWSTSTWNLYKYLKPTKMPQRQYEQVYSGLICLSIDSCYWINSTRRSWVCAYSV